MKKREGWFLIGGVSITIAMLGYALFVHSPYLGKRLIDTLKARFWHTVTEKKAPILPLRGVVLDEQNTSLSLTQRIYKLWLANDALDNRTFCNLLKRLEQAVPIRLGVKAAYNRHRSRHANGYESFTVLSYGVTQKQIKEIENILTEPPFKLKKSVFQFELSGERIIYPYKDCLTPYLGLNRKALRGNYTYRKGVSGLQGYYDKRLSALSIKKRRQNLHLYVSIPWQKELEKELDIFKKEKHLREAMGVIIDPKNFHIKALASSNRYNPNRLSRKNKKNTEIHAVLYLFEIGDWITPLKNHLPFGFYEKSGIDLLYERSFPNKNITDIKKFKVNFMQLLKAYTAIYSGGKIASPHLADTSRLNAIKQVLAKEEADKIKSKLSNFFTSMRHQKLLIEQKDKNLSAHILIQPITREDKEYLKAYFLIKDETPSRL